MSKVIQYKPRLVPIGLFPASLLFALLVGAAIVGWHKRSSRFAAFVKLVEESGGEVEGVSRWGTDAKYVELPSRADVEEIRLFSKFAMAGRIGTLDLGRTQLSEDRLNEIPEWELINVDCVLWPD